MLLLLILAFFWLASRFFIKTPFRKSYSSSLSVDFLLQFLTRFRRFFINSTYLIFSVSLEGFCRDFSNLSVFFFLFFGRVGRFFFQKIKLVFFFSFSFGFKRFFINLESWSFFLFFFFRKEIFSITFCSYEIHIILIAMHLTELAPKRKSIDNVIVTGF